MLDNILGEADVSGGFNKLGIVDCITVTMLGIGPEGSAIAYCISARHDQFT